MRCDYAPVHIGLTTALLMSLAFGPCTRPAQAEPTLASQQHSLVGLAYEFELTHNRSIVPGFTYKSVFDNNPSSDVWRLPRRRFVPLRPIRLPGAPSATGFAVSSDFLRQVVQDTVPGDHQPQTEIEAAIAELDRQAEPSGDDSQLSLFVLDYRTLGGVFTAEDLKSDLDITFSGDIGKDDDKPVRFRTPAGRLQVSLQFDAPLTRLSERNSSP